MTTAALMDHSQDTRAHAAVLLSDDDADGSLLDQLRSDPHIVVLDTRQSCRRELEQLRPAPTANELAEHDQWAWYPWRRTLVGVPGPRAFRRLRLDRNRNKITLAEQDALGQLTIGIVGLSVGHSIAHTIALEGLCGRLRLADHDEIELTNLNRIPGTIMDIGINKAVVVARRIAELDPYLPIDVFPSGLTEELMETFLDGVDIVIEECDSLDIKIRVREEARARAIPVLMETSDRGLFDVERFDTEPDRPLFHGLLGDVDPGSLRDLSNRDKAPHVMRILESNKLSARMAASMVEIDRTVSTWPQLAGDVQLGGATLAAAIRRFGRDQYLPSGRVRIDLDTQLDELGTPTAVAESTPASPVSPQLSSDQPGGALESVVQAILLAPSGGNSQPWAVAVTPAGIDIHLVPARTSAMDVSFRGSYVAIGAAALNARVAAAQLSLAASIEAFPNGPNSDLVVSIGIEPTDGAVNHAAALAELYPAMINRSTNRNIGQRQDLPEQVTADLRAAADAEGARLHMVSIRSDIAALADVLAESDRIRFLTPVLHRQMMDEIKWPDRERADLGLDIRTLGLDAADLTKLEVSSRPDVMALLAGWHAGDALGDNTRDRVNASSAMAVLTVSGDSVADYVRGGMAAERVWVRANQHQLAVQPVSPVFLYARTEDELQALSADYHDELRALQKRFCDAVGLGSDDVPVLVLRLSHGAEPPALRSQRLPDDHLIFTPDPIRDSRGQ